MIRDYTDMIYRHRPVSQRYHMDTAQRAKQFAPFDALKGFDETVHGKEEVYEARRVMSEDRQAELNFQLRMLQYGAWVHVVYFDESRMFPDLGHYRSMNGTVKDICIDSHLLVDDTCIPMKNLWDLT